MKAEYKKDRNLNNGLIDLIARNEADIANVEKMARILVDHFGYDDIYGEELMVTLAIPGTIAEAMEDYREAKRIFKNS